MEQIPAATLVLSTSEQYTALIITIIACYCCCFVSASNVGQMYRNKSHSMVHRSREAVQ